MVIKVRDSVHGIYHKKNFICLLYCQSNLLVYFTFKNIFRVYHPTSGIYNGEIFPIPIHFAVLAVTSSTCRFIYNSHTSACKTIKKRGFAYIRASYYCYKLSHTYNILCFSIFQIICFPSYKNTLFTLYIQNCGVCFHDFANPAPLLQKVPEKLSCQKTFLFPFSHQCPHV